MQAGFRFTSPSFTSSFELVNIKALSVRQPWASAIMLGKDVENRSRYVSYRGELIIHAALRLDLDACENPLIASLGLPVSDLPLGQLLGVVTLVDCVRTSHSKWAQPDCWHLILENPRPFLKLIPFRGQLSLFNVGMDVLKAAGYTAPSFSLI
jgi:hypothetical protein